MRRKSEGIIRQHIATKPSAKSLHGLTAELVLFCKIHSLDIDPCNCDYDPYAETAPTCALAEPRLNKQ